MTIQRSVVSTEHAPGAIGPYSQAIIAGDLVFCSGQLPMDPSTGQLIEGSIEEQTRRVLDNLSGLLEAAGSSLKHVVKTTIFLADMNDFAAVNGAYGEYFDNEPPARSTVQAARLPRDARVEIEAIAIRA